MYVDSCTDQNDASQAETPHMQQPDSRDVTVCTAASRDHVQQQPPTTSDTEADLKLAILLSQLQQVLPQAAVTLPNSKRQFSLEQLHLALQNFLAACEGQQSSSTTASQQGTESEFVQDATPSNTAQHALPIQSMKEGRVALCLLMLNQWCTNARQHSNDLPQQAAAIINTVLASDNPSSPQPGSSSGSRTSSS